MIKDFIMTFGGWAILGSIVTGISINLIWKFIRDRQKQKAVATALIVELSYIARECKEMRDIISDGYIVGLTHPFHRSVFDTFLAEVPGLLRYYKLLP